MEYQNKGDGRYGHHRLVMAEAPLFFLRGTLCGRRRVVGPRTQGFKPFKSAVRWTVPDGRPRKPEKLQYQYQEYDKGLQPSVGEVQENRSSAR